MILDAETLALAPGVEALVAGAEAFDLPGMLKTELFASVVELTTFVCSTAHEAYDALAALRLAAGEIAERSGYRLAATGTHPFSRPEEQTIAPDDRYREFVEYAGISARRQGVSGLHVHVAMPSPDACMWALEGVLPWLPVVLALSANSPYLAGADTGLLSSRAETLGVLPRRGAPPPFRSFDDWEATVERLVASGLVRDYTAIWWDVRPHPRFGTLEIRMPDQPTSLGLTGAFVALLQALAVTVLERPPRPYDPGARAVYDQNRWAASRFGPRAKLVHPDRAGAIPATELGHELLELVLPTARALGADDLLEALDPASCEADRQLEVGRRAGLRAVCADLVKRSVASAPWPSSPTPSR